jgi:hypothetical protein
MNPEEVGALIREDIETVDVASVLIYSGMVVLGFAIGVRFAGVLVTSEFGHTDPAVLELVEKLKWAIVGGAVATVGLTASGFLLTYRKE